MFNKIIDTIFTPNPKDFQELQEIIFRSDDLIEEDKLTYLRKMFAIKEKWTAAYTPSIFHAGTHTISRAESVNSQVKSKVFRRSSLCDIFKLMNDILEKSIKRSVLARTQKVRHQVIHSPLLKSIYECYSSFAYEHMLYQYMLSHGFIIKRVDFDQEESDPHTGQYIVKDIDDREKHTVEIHLNRNTGKLQVECKCKFRTAQRMYCSHIMAVLNNLQIKTCEKFDPEDRWLDKLSNFLPEPENQLDIKLKQNSDFLHYIKSEKNEDQSDFYQNRNNPINDNDKDDASD